MRRKKKEEEENGANGYSEEEEEEEEEDDDDDDEDDDDISLIVSFERTRNLFLDNKFTLKFTLSLNVGTDGFMWSSTAGCVSSVMYVRSFANTVPYNSGEQPRNP